MDLAREDIKAIEEKSDKFYYSIITNRYKDEDGNVFVKCKCKCPLSTSCPKEFPDYGYGIYCNHYYDYIMQDLSTATSKDINVNIGRTYYIKEHPKAEDGIRILIISSSIKSFNDDYSLNFEHTLVGYVDCIKDESDGLIVSSYKNLKKEEKKSNVAYLIDHLNTGDSFLCFENEDNIYDFLDTNKLISNNAIFQSLRCYNRTGCSLDCILIKTLFLIEACPFVNKYMNNGMQSLVVDMGERLFSCKNRKKLTEEINYMNYAFDELPDFIATRLYKKSSPINDYFLWNRLWISGGIEEQDVKEFIDSPKYWMFDRTDVLECIVDILEHGYVYHLLQVANYIRDQVKRTGYGIGLIAGYMKDYVRFSGALWERFPDYPEDIKEARCELATKLENEYLSILDKYMLKMSYFMENETNVLFQTSQIGRQFVTLFPQSREEFGKLNDEYGIYPYMDEDDYIRGKLICFELRNAQEPDIPFILVKMEIYSLTSSKYCEAYFYERKEKVTEPVLLSFLNSYVDDISHIRDDFSSRCPVPKRKKIK